MTAPDASPLRYLSRGRRRARRCRRSTERLRARRADAGRARRPTPSCRRRSASIRARRLVRPRHAGAPARRRSGRRDDLLGHEVDRRLPVNRAQGLPAIHGVVLLTDPTTGVPTAILDAGPITAERTAASAAWRSRRFAPAPVDGRAPRVAIIGAGRPGPQPPRGARSRPARRSSWPSSTGTRTGRRPGRRGRGATAGIGRRRGRRRAPARRSRAPTSSSPPPRSGPTTPGADQRLAGARTPSSSPVDYATYVPPRSPATPACSSSTSASSSSPTATPACSTAIRTRRATSARRSSPGSGRRLGTGRRDPSRGGPGRPRRLRRRDPAAPRQPRGWARSCRAEPRRALGVNHAPVAAGRSGPHSLTGSGPSGTSMRTRPSSTTTG